MFELTKYQFYGKGMPVIPIRMISGAVPGGYSPPASDYYGDTITLDRNLIKNPDFTYLMGVVGDSMIEADILPGSWIIVDRSEEPVNGSIVVARLDGELTVKYYIRTTDACFLIPANPKHQDIEITELTDFVVWGVVIHVIPTVKPINYIQFV
jgi:DNA polymerase V